MAQFTGIAAVNAAPSTESERSRERSCEVRWPFQVRGGQVTDTRAWSPTAEKQTGASLSERCCLKQPRDSSSSNFHSIESLSCNNNVMPAHLCTWRSAAATAEPLSGNNSPLYLSETSQPTVSRHDMLLFFFFFPSQPRSTLEKKKKDSLSAPYVNCPTESLISISVHLFRPSSINNILTASSTKAAGSL